MSTRSSAAPTAAPAAGKVRMAFVVQAGLIGAALAIYVLVLAQAGLQHQDFSAYLSAARDLWQGQPLYATFLHHPFPDPTLRPAYIYPPVFALVVAPLGLLPDPLANLTWLIASQASLAGALILTLRWFRPPAWATFASVLATLTFYPLWVDGVQGQANLLVLLLVTAGLLGIVRGEPRFALALGAAAALKLTPAILLIWLLLDRRWRDAGWMVLGFVLLTATGAVVRFHETLVFFGQVLPALAPGTAFYANQSLGAMLLRVFSANPYTQPWTQVAWPLVLLAGGALLLIGSWFWRTRHQAALLRGTAFLPLLLLLSSVTWVHHLVILLPLIWLCAMALAERDWPLGRTASLVGVLLLINVVSRWPVGPAVGQAGFRAAQTTDAAVFLVANALFVGTLILFFMAPWLLRSR